jgi:hypothetical protein
VSFNATGATGITGDTSNTTGTIGGAAEMDVWTLSVELLVCAGGVEDRGEESVDLPSLVEGEDVGGDVGGAVGGG